MLQERIKTINTTLPMIEIASEPRQPARFEKNTNIFTSCQLIAYQRSLQLSHRNEHLENGPGASRRCSFCSGSGDQNTTVAR